MWVCSYQQYTLVYVHTSSIPWYMFIPAVYLGICSYHQYTLLYVHTSSIPWYMFIPAVYLVVCSYQQYTLFYVYTISTPCYVFIPAVYLVVWNKVIIIIMLILQTIQESCSCYFCPLISHKYGERTKSPTCITKRLRLTPSNPSPSLS